MLAEAAGAVIGTGTHRDSHEAGIADAAGQPIATIGSATTAPGSRSCWPPSPKWRPAVLTLTVRFRMVLPDQPQEPE